MCYDEHHTVYSSPKLLGYHIKEHEMSGSCSTCGRERNAYNILVGTLKKKQITLKAQHMNAQHADIYTYE
jgi:hypothetical protein